jgi:hypothetical protein
LKISKGERIALRFFATVLTTGSGFFAVGSLKDLQTRSFVASFAAAKERSKARTPGKDSLDHYIADLRAINTTFTKDGVKKPSQSTCQRSSQQGMH